MYHIEKDHEAIIPPATFQLVQDEMERRRSVPHSGDTILSGKIICGDCGKSYGPKVWHSNDKYRKVVWQCNHKYQGDRTCTTPHVYDALYKQYAAAEDELRKLEKSIHSEEMRQRRSNKYSPTHRNQRLLHCVQLPFVLLHLCAFDKQKAALSLSAYESGACHTPDHPNRRPPLPAAGLHPSPHSEGRSRLAFIRLLLAETQSQLELLN